MTRDDIETLRQWQEAARPAPDPWPRVVCVLALAAFFLAAALGSAVRLLAWAGGRL